MSEIEVLYQKVNSVLAGLCEKQHSIETKKTICEHEIKEGFQRIDTETNKAFTEITSIEARLNGFINIASAHAIKLFDNGGVQEYDNGTLSRLAVQINNASSNDRYAEELYTLATSQIRYIQKKKALIQQDSLSQKQSIERKYRIEQINIKKEEDQLSSQISECLASSDFFRLIELLSMDRKKFDSSYSINYSIDDYTKEISLGVCDRPLSVPRGFETKIATLAQGMYNISTSSLSFPYKVSLYTGCSFLIEYNNENEEAMNKGIQNFLFNIIRNEKNIFSQIIFIDPIRYNNSTLGILAPFSLGNNSIIDNVPLSNDEVKKKLSEIIHEISLVEKNRNINEEAPFAKRIIILHGYPYAYDSSLLTMIQQLMVNAVHNNLLIIATHNISTKSGYSFDGNLIKSVSTQISCNEQGFTITYNCKKQHFSWYCIGTTIPNDLIQGLIINRPQKICDNDYIKRIGLSVSRRTKGMRDLINIPYGVDDEGDILTLDFENSNFATFICGAARSGKSTLLHTILTYIIQNYHPDDVEIWLIDFKMTEFSRYINHRPPHIRYIILDESPELVYDLIDRLTEVLEKRQSIFMERWVKLKDVPIEKYMPSIFVIIDEFSIMSQIVADSVISASEDYALKLQKLLAKGAALGFHFIFASQGFTDGSRGLTPFSKKQIQLRLAMKTDYIEIKETLDLKSISDEDRKMMEQLEPHHVLVRTHVDEIGNHLKLAKTLYISDYTKQDDMIDIINGLYSSVSKYDPDDSAGYIDKKTVIVNGNRYKAFYDQEKEIEHYVNSRLSSEDHIDYLFVGEPKRLKELYPIEVYDGFSENVLLFAPAYEVDPGVSIILSIANSLKYSLRKVSILANRRDAFFRKVPLPLIFNLCNVSKEIEDVCKSIKHYKTLIDNKSQGNEYIFVFGADALLMDMSYFRDSIHASSNNPYEKISSMEIEKREENEPDILTILSMAENDDMSFYTDNDTTIYEEESVIEESVLYDARDDLNYILTHGPRYGYHFIFVFANVGEFNQCKVSSSLFKHKITFRLPKSDAMDLFGASKSNAVLNLSEHCYRYSNGLDSVSFRPFMHPSLSWDGWVLNGNIIEMSVLEEDEYLL